MKTPISMIEGIAADIIENTSLLEVIYRNYELPTEADNAIACLIRSLYKTLDTANEHINMLSPQSAPPQAEEKTDIADDIFYASITANKLRELHHVYTETFFTDKDNENPSCLMAAVLFDYAINIDKQLKAIKTRLS